jgi:SAM-dependent methyltransferase
MDYTNNFSKRAASYLHALITYPAALNHEFRTAVAMCALNENDTLLLIPCSCEHIQPFLDPSIKCIEYETNKELANLTAKPFCEFHTIPLSPKSVDCILSLATLHHLTDQERLAFYTEARRLLNPNGKLVLGDVIKDSAQDRWLNTFVDTYNSYGHKGRFFTPADAHLLESAGFSVEIQTTKYTWDFTSMDEMIDFCRNLFHLDKANYAEIQEGLQTYLNVTDTTIEWELVYYVCSLN